MVKNSDVTPEERAALRADSPARIAAMLEALETISTLKPSQGTIPCPKCKSGTLRYSRASNGHVWGHCSTRLCLSWMQ